MLNMTNAAILNNDELKGLKSAFDIASYVDTYLSESMGIQPYPQPSRVPQDLSEIDDLDGFSNDQLGLLHAKYTAYAAFINCKLASIIGAYKVSDVNLKQITARLSTQLYAKEGLAKSEVPARVKSHPTYIEFEMEHTKLYMMKQLVEARYASYDKQAKAISRIISVREMEFQQQVRDDIIQKKKPARRRFNQSGASDK